MPTRADIERLAAARDPLSVSVFLPTTTVPKDNDENLLRARGLFEQAIAEVRQRTDKRTALALEEQLTGLLNHEEFWWDLGRSLAIFATPTSVVEYRLPNVLTEYACVSDRFAITPLLRAVTFPQAAFVLALSQNGARLVEISADQAPQEITLEGAPVDAASNVGLPSIGGRAPYGRIQGDEGRKVRLTQFARAIDHALRPILNGESLPLILAAAEPLASIYRNLCGYAGLAAEGIDGNPDELTDAQLADESRGVLDRIYADELKALHELFEERRNSGRATTDLSDLARAAAFGALDTLVVDMDDDVPGSVHDDGTLTLGPDNDHDVLEEIARRALATDARVLAVRRADLPGEVQAAGVLRFAV